VTGVLTSLTAISFIADYARNDCPNIGQYSPHSGGPFFSEAILALYGDPTLQVMAAILGVLLVLIVWRRVFI
jgi:hypothetical protein